MQKKISRISYLFVFLPELKVKQSNAHLPNARLPNASTVRENLGTNYRITRGQGELRLFQNDKNPTFITFHIFRQTAF